MAKEKKPEQFDKQTYDYEYSKKNLRKISFYLNRNTENDIIEFLEKQKNIGGFIKQLIRDHISK